MNKVLKKVSDKINEGFVKVGSRIIESTHGFKTLMKDKSGDQITGWLIVVLLVMVCGAVFLALYQSSIQEIWQGIINKMKSVFGI
jgi:hypothetical protein